MITTRYILLQATSTKSLIELPKGAIPLGVQPTQDPDSPVVMFMIDIDSYIDAYPEKATEITARFDNLSAAEAKAEEINSGVKPE